jgi:phosphate-selective porin
MRTFLAGLALAGGFAMQSIPAHADDAALKSEVQALRAEVAALKSEVEQIRGGLAQSAASTVPTSPQPASVTVANDVTTNSEASAPNPGTTSRNPGNAAGAGTTLWGYGQLDYNRPTARPADAQFDLSRAVIGFNHVFDESTRIYGELEWEHAIASSTDAGESEVEQLYIEHALAPSYGVRAGLMLVPIGLLNEHHEPTQFYGVERNFVEQAIIPSTWREGGIAGYGSTDSGWQWDVGLVTSPNLGKWDPTSDEGRASPLGSIHQELQLAKAHDASLWGRLNWLGVPGLNIGAAFFAGKIGQDTSRQFDGDSNFPADNARLLLGEAHARWQSGPWDLSALYARGTISDTQALNLGFLGQPTPVPKSFWGGYAQGAWRALEWNRSSLAPFLRYEEFNTGASYAEQPQGLGTPALPTQRVWTAGMNYYLNPNVVFKIDYQNFRYDDVVLNYGNRFDLGIGYQF